MLFNDIIQEWFNHKRYLIKESSLSNYEAKWCQLQPYWGNIVIEDVRSRHIQQFINQKLSEGKLSVKTIEDMVIMLKNIIKYVQINYEIPVFNFNITYPTNNIIEGDKKKKNYKKEEVKTIIDYVENNPSYQNYGILMAIYTGLRIGELCALTFEDVDFENKCINVRKTIQRLQHPGEKSKVIITPPKTRTSNRKIPLHPYLERWLKNAIKVCRIDYYIVSGTNKFIEPRTYRNHFIKVLKEIGLERIKFHGLRHTYASMLITSNVDIRTTSELLGHSDVSTTLNIYAHSNDDLKKKAIINAFKF